MLLIRVATFNSESRRRSEIYFLPKKRDIIPLISMHNRVFVCKTR